MKRTALLRNMNGMKNIPYNKTLCALCASVRDNRVSMCNILMQDQNEFRYLNCNI